MYAERIEASNGLVRTLGSAFRRSKLPWILVLIAVLPFFSASAQATEPARQVPILGSSESETLRETPTLDISARLNSPDRLGLPSAGVAVRNGLPHETLPSLMDMPTPEEVYIAVQPWAPKPRFHLRSA
jgi:hypothetical protein